MSQNCLSDEKLLELATIRDELGFFESVRPRLHLKFCSHCREKSAQMQQTFQAYFNPEPEIASSLLRVYSRLQQDETLVLKGWKLDEPRPKKSSLQTFWKNGWVFRGSVAMGIAGLVALVAVPDFVPPSTPSHQSTVAQSQRRNEVPFARIRVRDKNRVQVHYVQPELLETMEFETVSFEK